MDDRPLTEFTDSAESDAGEDSEEGSGADERRIDPATVDPAGITYAWSPGGEACEVCGATVGRLWRRETDPGRVCADCKEW